MTFCLISLLSECIFWWCGKFRERLLFLSVKLLLRFFAVIILLVAEFSIFFLFSFISCRSKIAPGLQITLRIHISSVRKVFCSVTIAKRFLMVSFCLRRHEFKAFSIFHSWSILNKINFYQILSLLTLIDFWCSL